MIWLKRLSGFGILCGLILGLVGLIPILSPNQGEGAHDGTILILAGALLAVGIGAFVVSYVIGALQPDDEL